jgi:CheY-like chemotaxis protein
MMRSGPATVLIVEDEALIAMDLQWLLEEAGYRVTSAVNGEEGLKLFEASSFDVVVTDYRMPKMDGLQVLAIVRRKFPQLRTAVLTAVPDEQFRSRAYAIGVDIYFEKPGTTEEISLFLDCIESLLSQEAQGAFRGLQSKSLVDIIQLECLSQSSSVLRITNGVQEGKIWFQNGEVIDAVARDLAGEIAFQKILSWKTGNFEILPTESCRKRTILTSYQALLLESAQALDEAQAENIACPTNLEDTNPHTGAQSLVHAISQVNGVESVLTCRSNDPKQVDSWSVEDPEQIVAWTRSTLKNFRELGELLQVGPLAQIKGISLQRQFVLASDKGVDFCIGFQRSISAEQILATAKTILGECAS